MPSQPPKPPNRPRRKLHGEIVVPGDRSVSQVEQSTHESSHQFRLWFAVLITGVILLILLLLIAAGIGLGIAMKLSSSDDSSSVAQAPGLHSTNDTESTNQVDQSKDDSDAANSADTQPSDRTSTNQRTPPTGATGARETSPDRPLGDEEESAEISTDAPVITIPSSGFFGIVAEGNKFVYVVDCSGSMSGLPFTRAKQEVMRSISSLSEGQAYSIIFFATESYSMYYPSIINHMEKPTQDVLQRTETWLDGFSIHGGTEPLGALLKALQMEPDAIFFLTDGGFEAHVAAIINQANTNSVSINTICFISRAGEPILKQIAKANQGDYRFVP